MINNIGNSNVQTAESRSNITPKTAIELLKKGNQRFVANQAMQIDIVGAMYYVQTGVVSFL